MQTAQVPIAKAKRISPPKVAKFHHKVEEIDQIEIHGHLIDGVTQATGLENELVKLIEQKITFDKEVELQAPNEPVSSI